MRLASLGLVTLAICCGVAFTPGQAALDRNAFPPRTTGDLINLCSAAKDDPLMTAAVNFCQGFAEGAVEVALSYEAVTREGRQPFCLPTPRPSHDQAVAEFSAWGNADPNRLAEPPVVGLMRFLIHQYPCPHPVAARRGQK